VRRWNRCPKRLSHGFSGCRGTGRSRHVFDEARDTVTCWVRPTAPHPYYCCPRCGISTQATAGDPAERQVRDLPWGPWQVWLVVEIQTVACRRCGRHRERVPFLVGKAHHTAWVEPCSRPGLHQCPGATGNRPVGPGGGNGPLDRHTGAVALGGRPRRPLRQLGVDEIFLGKTTKFLTVVSTHETREPLWMGKERKRETLDRFFAEALPPRLRRAVQAVCVDMWEPFRQSLRPHLPHARLVYDKFHVLKHANAAVDETRPAPRSSGGAASSAASCGGSAGCSSHAGTTWHGTSGRPSGPSTQKIAVTVRNNTCQTGPFSCGAGGRKPMTTLRSTVAWPRPTCSGTN